MTMMTTAPLSLAPRSRWNLANALARITSAHRRARKERDLARALTQFAELSPHLLRDMGVTCDSRAPLHELVRQAHAFHGR